MRRVPGGAEENGLLHRRQADQTASGRQDTGTNARYWLAAARHLTLRVGDLLALTADDQPIDPPSNDNAETARIGCTLPHVLAAVAAATLFGSTMAKLGRGWRKRLPMR